MCICTYMYVYVYIYIHTYASIYMCMWIIFIDIHWYYMCVCVYSAYFHNYSLGYLFSLPSFCQWKKWKHRETNLPKVTQLEGCRIVNKLQAHILIHFSVVMHCLQPYLQGANYGSCSAYSRNQAKLTSLTQAVKQCLWGGSLIKS
jgi:hypothetical protein